MKFFQTPRPSTPNIPPTGTPDSTSGDDSIFILDNGDSNLEDWNILSGTAIPTSNLFEAGIITTSSFTYPPVPSLNKISSDSKILQIFKAHIFGTSTRDYIFTTPKAVLYNSISSFPSPASDVRVIVGSNYMIDNPRINISFYGKSNGNYLEFISDINFHEKIKLPAVMLTSKKEFVTLTFIPIYNEITNVSTTIIKVQKGDVTSNVNISLNANTEFYIFTSYNVKSGINGQTYSNTSESDGDYYCR